MEKSFRYQALAHWTTHKRGILEAPEIPRTVNFAAPPEFGGEPGLWTPEHLLLGAVSTCYIATFRAIAEHSRLRISKLEVQIEGVIAKAEGSLRFTEIVLRPVVSIDKEEDSERAHRVAQKAEQSCLIANSLSTKITMQAKVEVAEAVMAE